MKRDMCSTSETRICTHRWMGWKGGRGGLGSTRNPVQFTGHMHHLLYNPSGPATTFRGGLRCPNGGPDRLVHDMHDVCTTNGIYCSFAVIA